MDKLNCLTLHKDTSMGYMLGERLNLHYKIMDRNTYNIMVD